MRDWRHLSSNKALREELLGQLSKVSSYIDIHSSDPTFFTQHPISLNTLTQYTDIQTFHTFQAQLEAIYENYKVDFEMFNYSMDKYL